MFQTAVKFARVPMNKFPSLLKSLAFLMLVGIAAESLAFAGSVPACGVGTVANILGTTCTIGFLQFTFQGTVWPRRGARVARSIASDGPRYQPTPRTAEDSIGTVTAACACRITV
jgi:hypothetical protein